MLKVNERYEFRWFKSFQKHGLRLSRVQSLRSVRWF